MREYIYIYICKENILSLNIERFYDTCQMSQINRQPHKIYKKVNTYGKVRK